MTLSAAMKRKFRIAALLTIMLASVTNIWPQVAWPRTIGQMLTTLCPNGKALKSAVDAADEASAVNDSDAPVLSREAARQYYRCAHVTDEVYLHDWARFFYFVYLWGSFVTKGDVNLNGSGVLDGLSQLAAGSQFGDVRSAATRTYNDYDHNFEDIRQQLGPP
jgi:hypothetical protein